jgi:ATP-dependent RNA helicase DOB1
VTKLKEELAAPLRVMQEIARRIAKISKESKLSLEEDEYVSSFKVELMDAVVQWCRGASFTEVCKVSVCIPPIKLIKIVLTFLKLTDQFEGSLIRVFRRLQELIRQMSQAAKVIGNSELQEKFDKASEMLERPNSVIFCSSLYL